MIEIPDRLIRQIREQSKTKPTVTNDIKPYLSVRRQLSYVSGYIVSELYQKSRIKKIECDSKLQALLQALKSSGQDNEFILARSRGGLVSPSHHLMDIVEELRFV